MVDKDFFGNLKNGTNSALSKVFNKVEEVSKAATIRLKINSLKTQIKDVKKGIGDHVYINRKDFEEIEELKVLIEKIQVLEDRIEQKQEQLAEL